jgi:hypothetical protein
MGHQGGLFKDQAGPAGSGCPPLCSEAPSKQRGPARFPPVVAGPVPAKGDRDPPRRERYSAAGSVKVKVAPSPGRLSTHTRPWCAWTSICTMYRPSPSPSALCALWPR